jgi:hypothetical protein
MFVSIVYLDYTILLSVLVWLMREATEGRTWGLVVEGFG